MFVCITNTYQCHTRVQIQSTNELDPRVQNTMPPCSCDSDAFVPVLLVRVVLVAT